MQQTSNVKHRVKKVLWALNMPEKERVEFLLNSANDTSPQVRKNAAYMMYKHISPKYIPSLKMLLKDPHQDVRFSAADAIGWYGEYKSKFESDLIEALTDNNSTTRICAADSLGAFASQKAVKKLMQMAVKDESFIARTIALRALANIKGALGIEWLENRLKKEQVEVYPQIYDNLIRLKQDDYYLELLDLLDHKDYKVRAATLSAIIYSVSYEFETKAVAKDIRAHQKKEKSKYCQEIIKKGLKFLRGKIKEEDNEGY